MAQQKMNATAIIVKGNDKYALLCQEKWVFVTLLKKMKSTQVQTLGAGHAIAK